MESIANRARMLRKNLGLTQSQIAKESSMGQTAYAEIENGNVAYPRRIYALAKALHTIPQYLLFGENEITAKKHRVPLLNSISAGKWSTVEEEQTD